MDTELNRKLVSEVKKRPVLYHIELKANRTQEDISRAWAEITTVVDRSEKFCKDRWMNLRSTYGKDLQKPQMTYYLRDDMDFLKLHVTSIKCKRLIWEDNSRPSQSKDAGTSHRTVEPEAVGEETVLFNLPYNTETNDENPVPGTSGIKPSMSSDGSSCSHQTPPSDYRDYDEEILHIKSEISYTNVEPTDEYKPESASSRLDAESTFMAGRNSVQSPGKGRVASGKHTQEKGIPSKLSLDSRSQQFSLLDGIKSEEENGRTPRGSVTPPSTGIKRKKKITTKSKKRMPIDAKSRRSFMESLGQEIRQMSDEQFRSFRSHVSIKIEKILNDDDRDSNDDSGSEYASASDSDDDSDVIPL